MEKEQTPGTQPNEWPYQQTSARYLISKELHTVINCPDCGDTFMLVIYGDSRSVACPFCEHLWHVVIISQG